jgi:hypothetical protein
MRQDIIRYICTCDPCQKIKHDQGVGTGFLQPLKIPAMPFDTITIDLIMGLPKSSKNDAILVVIDKLMKFAQFIATTADISATGIAVILFKQSIKIFGMPKTIVGDRDPCWTSSIWKSLSQLVDMHPALLTSKHPQMDDQMEVMDQQLETMLHTYVQSDRGGWVKWLDVLQLHTTMPSIRPTRLPQHSYS